MGTEMAGAGNLAVSSGIVAAGAEIAVLLTGPDPDRRGVTRERPIRVPTREQVSAQR